jgi:hypothetical protein
VQRLFDTLERPGVVTVLGSISLLMLLVSLVAVPWLCCGLPVDYLDLSAPAGPSGFARRVVRNVFGSLLLVVGVLMLVLPGQGLLTILIGLTLLDFPGKRRFVRRLLMRPQVLRVINAIRRRFGVAPLQVDRSDPS